MFEIFPWNPQLETGIDLIDEQHRVLVNLINRLAQQHVQGATQTEVQAILDKLADYANYHFRTEEGIWHTALAGDAWLDKHIETHQHFFTHMVELQSGQREFHAVLDDLFSYLIQWLAYHILDNDKRMALALKAVAEGLSIEAAQAQADAHMQGATATLIQTVLGMYQTLSSQALELMHEKLARQRAEKSLMESEVRWRLLRSDSCQTPTGWSPTEHKLRTLLDSLPSGVAAADVQTRQFVFANPWFCQMLGYSENELLGMGTQDIHPAEALHLMQADFERTLPGQTRTALAIPVRRKDASVFMASIERVPLELDGQLSILAVFTDITERHTAAASLDAERLRLQNAIDAALAGTWEWDMTANVVHYNERFGIMLGFASGGSYQGTFESFIALLHPHDRQQGQLLVARHLRGDAPRFELEVRLRHKAGHWVWFRSLGRVTQRDAQNAPLLMTGISIDISAQKTHLEQIDHITHHDALTGLPNRKLFVTLLSIAMAAYTTPHKHLAVAYIDLDGLAVINEVHGRETGNQLLLEVSRRLTQTVREQEHIAHIGGDEFAVILGNVDAPEGDLDASVACLVPVKRLLEAVAAPIHLQGLTLQVTASIGITLYPQGDKVDAEQLLRQADQAMYLAKLAGKNRHHLFDPVNDGNTRERFLRINEVREGLLRDEFVLHYQPKVHLISGDIIGFEALIRWQHPVRGLVPPGAFIPLLDKHPMAITLGDWVIEAALAQLAQWNAQSLRTMVSVNIDSLQLHDPDFAERLQRQLRAQPTVQPNQLELEILETGAMEDMAHVSALIRQLHAQGLACALDDFGTGYSSMTFLKQLTARTLKIDQSFVRGMLDDAEHAAIVSSVLDLARNFDRRALAEGIETQAHGQALIEFGCEYGQGYAIARPMPAAAVPGWVVQWRTPQTWANTLAVGLQEIPVLLAAVAHSAWLKHLRAYATGQESQPPEVSHQICRFGQWLVKRSTQQHYHRHPEFAVLSILHAQLHDLARQVINKMAAHAPVTADLLALDALSDEMLAALRKLRQMPGNAQGPDSAFWPA